MMKVLHYEIGPMPTNTYVAYDEETKAGFMIDPAVHVPEITDKIKELGIDLQYIILTHGHFDHIEGVEAFKKDFPQVKVICHSEEREMLKSGALNSSLDFRGWPYTTDADQTVRHRETLKVGNLELTFFHTPGHSKGGISIYVPGTPGYCFSGDTLFRRSIGRSDFYGGDFRTLINSIKDVLFYLPDDTVVLPGHMGPTTIAEEKRGNPFV
jgi:glyoxylase-like metal-dependent hydrolase (beta-lactamase superfamily II)